MHPTRWVHASVLSLASQQDPPNQHGNQTECD